MPRGKGDERKQKTGRRRKGAGSEKLLTNTEVKSK